MPSSASQRLRALAALPVALTLTFVAASRATAADQVYFSAVDNVAAKLVERINAETVRIDMSAWYLTDTTVYNALLAAHRRNVPVRLIGDRGSIFEIDQLTKNAFYYLAARGVPIRLRYNPTWFPEIDHWKATIFVGQGVVSFGSANYTPFELAPWSATNYKDEIVLFTDDATLVDAFTLKFDRYWNDTAGEPESLIPTAPYFKNWDDACPLESACSDYSSYKAAQPDRANMVVNTARLFNRDDIQLPASVVWGQGPSFNDRLVSEINAETTAVDFVIYRLTVDNITQALLAKYQAGVPVRLIVEPLEYENRKWPEFWITHANIDKLWAAGVPIKRRLHEGLTHMKVLVTSSIATVASSNFAAAWQRDHNYFLPRATKPAIHTAIKNRFQTMWADTAGFGDFTPGWPDAPTPTAPAPGATGVAATAALTWSRAVFATSYDVYLGTAPGSMTLVGNVPAQIVNDPPQTYSFTPSSPLAANTTYYWRVVSRTNATVRNPSIFAASSNQSFTTGSTPAPGGPIPTPWQTQDVGSVGQTGSASFASGTFTVRGAGADIWGTADAFRFVYQPVSGDATIVARVTDVQNTNPYAKAGLMVRQGLTAGGAHVILDVRPDGWVEFMTRSTTGGATTYLAGTSMGRPTWLRLVRAGNTITGSVSADGTSWTQIGSTTLAFSGSPNVGLLVNSHDTAVLNTSTFDNVTVTTGSTPPPPPPPTGVPAPWTTQDVGSTGMAGSASASNGVFTVSGGGADIWGATDAFRYVSQPISGDVQIVARVTAMQNTHQWAKAGVMLRQSLTATSPHVLLSVTPGGTVEFLSRTANGGQTTLVASSSLARPSWLRLSRTGSTITAAVSSNGTTWTQVGTTTTTVPSSANVGLVVNSHDTSVLNTATFDNVTVGTPSAPPPPPPSGVPAPWTTQDVGTTGQAGNASHSNGVFTLAGAGADIWGSTDAFRYVSQPASGDVQIVVRVTQVQNTHQWAKAGVMLRQTLTATSPHVLLSVTPGGTIEFLSRTATGGETSVVGYGSQGAPVWLRLSRSGSTVTGAYSANGSAWTTLGSTTTTVATSANVGMIVTSHDVNTLNTSTFDNVTVGSPSTPPPPPPPTASNVVIYAADIPAAGRHGSWTTAADAGSPSGTKLVTTDTGLSNPDSALAAPVHYVDVTFNADAATPYRVWLRLKALDNSKFNDAVWVQFSDSLFNGAPVYRTNTTSGLLVNLATDGTGSSLNGWGWQNTAYWLSQATTITFQNSGQHTMRIQIREDGVQFDQIVLSPSQFLNTSPGSLTNDTVIVAKP